MMRGLDENSSARSTLSSQERAYQRQLAKRLSILQQSHTDDQGGSTSSTGTDLGLPRPQQRPYQSIRRDLLALHERNNGGQNKPSGGRRNNTIKMPPIQEEDQLSTSLLTKDYRMLAETYKAHEVYRSSSNNPNSTATCILCKKQNTPISKAFWPCEHQCACDMCILRHRIGSARIGSSQSNLCPLCKEEIKLVLRARGGQERKEYEDWLHETPAVVSSSFVREFRARSLQEIQWATRQQQDRSGTRRSSSARTKHSRVVPKTSARKTVEDDYDEYQYAYQQRRGPACAIQ